VATSNFLQFNPTAVNQDTDAAYLADATRLGGAIDGNEWPSLSANKTLYQASTAIAALMQMMANKGFTVSDTALSTLTAQLSNILTTADGRSALQHVAWASTVSLNAARYDGFEIDLSDNIALTVIGQSIGQLITLIFTKSGISPTVTYPSNVFGGGQPDLTPGAVSVQLFKVDILGNLHAAGPVVSVNGMGGLPLGNFSPADVNAATLRVAGVAPLGQVLTGNGTSFVPVAAGSFSTCIRTNKVGSYALGTTYTNSTGKAVFEEVTFGATQSDDTGRGWTIQAFIDGAQGPINGITNFSYGYASVGFWVPSGSSFEVTATLNQGGMPPHPWGLFAWTEVTF
jgi:hypothetical protein